MKNFLRLSVFLMVIAGLYGFAAMVLDLQNGKLIQYEHDSPVAAVKKRTTLPVQIAVIRKGQKAGDLDKSIMQFAVINSAVKPLKPRLRIADLDVRSFSRGDIRFEPPMVADIDSIVSDSAKLTEKPGLRTLVVVSKPDSTKR
ncbi:MAG: hypothetical protein ACHQRM_07775 [Bacteroidia bacterium]